ncbi:MAG: DUF1232 domain-containing protein [Betaproteobacteria bacterium]|nr:DUF1232 domain-containing protein [Betaproteobacteria bacterium]
MSQHPSTYSSSYSDQGLFDVLKRFAKSIGSETVHKALCLWLVIRDSNAPAWAKAVAVGALGYLISPIDAIPDLIPFIGFTDDIAVIAAAVVTLSLYITDDISARATAMMPTWLQD